RPNQGGLGLRYSEPRAQLLSVPKDRSSSGTQVSECQRASGDARACPLLKAFLTDALSLVAFARHEAPQLLAKGADLLWRVPRGKRDAQTRRFARHRGIADRRHEKT